VSDPVNHPTHYRGGVYEAINVITAWRLDFLRGNVVKYVCRAGLKDPRAELEDLKKARFYLDHAIAQLSEPGESDD
jgi:hypothetical protein